MRICLFKKKKGIKEMETQRSNKETREELARLAQRFASLGERYAKGEECESDGPWDKRQNVARMYYRLSMQAEYARRALLYLARAAGEEMSEEEFAEEREASFLVGHDSHDALKRLEVRCGRYLRKDNRKKKGRYNGGFRQ